jgi:GNAT superfamily N-acetyltransferase
MIRRCVDADFPAIEAIINEAAQAYRGVIPADCWHEPYMPASALKAEIDAGVNFWGWDESGGLIGIMGLQQVRDATLIRHAYVGTAHQGRGIGAALLAFLADQATGPLLVGTWAAAAWAIRFYERHGFRLLSPAEKDRLLACYWSIPPRQQETSVVLVSTHHSRPTEIEPPNAGPFTPPTLVPQALPGSRRVSPQFARPGSETHRGNGGR